MTLGLLLRRVSKLLTVPALMLVGLAVGPGGVGLLSEPRFVYAASDIGLVLLLFYTALFAHPNALRNGGRIALPLAAYDLVLNFAVAYWIGSLFHWDLAARLLLAGVLSTSSTGAVLKILTDEGRLLRREGQVLMALLWIEDLAFVGYYLFLTGRLSLAAGDLHTGLLLGLLVFVGFLVLLGFLRESVWRIPHPETLVPLVTGLGLLGAWSGSLGGLPVVASAFATGLVLSGSRGASFVQTEAPYLREIAGSIFFFAFGAMLDPHVTWGILPLAAAALVGLLLTEALFLPLVARLLGLTGLESVVVGSTLLARGGKSAAFARAADASSTPHTSEIQSASGLLTILLTPLAPLAVRLMLSGRRRELPAGAVRPSHDILGRITRRLLAPGAYAQRATAGRLERWVVAGWILLPTLLALLALLVDPPLRWVPTLAGLAILPLTARELRRFLQELPGTPATTYGLRRSPLPRLETHLTPVLLLPVVAALLLAPLAPVAAFAFPVVLALALVFLLAWPAFLHPVPRAPRLSRALPRSSWRHGPARWRGTRSPRAAAPLVDGYWRLGDRDASPAPTSIASANPTAPGATNRIPEPGASSWPTSGPTAARNASSSWTNRSR